MFDKSIAGLQRLNALGYGKPGSGLVLNLVFNPQGPVLPPEEPRLTDDYRRELGTQFGIVFNALHVIANMPIQRFGSTLVAAGRFDEYMTLLKHNFSGVNLERVMCRTLLSVDWQGRLYDCDFNQQLILRAAGARHLRDLLDTQVDGAPIVVADHCYGCTAGQQLWRRAGALKCPLPEQGAFAAQVHFPYW